jgi:hypothetical protein
MGEVSHLPLSESPVLVRDVRSGADVTAANVTEAGVPSADGIYGWVDAEMYHADRGSLSVSGAKLLLHPSCPAKFRWKMDNEQRPKRIWDFGHVAHHLILGKGADFRVLNPEIDGLKADGSPSDKPTATAMWKDAERAARAKGLIPIHIDDHHKAAVMAAKVLNDAEAAPIFASGQAEMSIYATDPITGIRLRGRIDWINHEYHNDGTVLIDDVKTSVTADPFELEKKFYDLGYWMQRAWYEDLLILAGLAEKVDFVFTVVEKTEPHVVTNVRYLNAAVEEGRRANREAIDLYARCMETGKWPEYVSDIVTIGLPPWAGEGI